MLSKSSHLLQYRVELHDLFYRKGHSEQTKMHRLSLLAHDLLNINSLAMKTDVPEQIPAVTAVKGAICIIRILNLCGKNASQAFMCDGEPDSSDAYALVIEGNALSKAVREFNRGGDVSHLKNVISVGMEMLAVYVRQCWARDYDLHKGIVAELDEEVVDELFYQFHRVEIDRLVNVAKAAIAQTKTASSLPM